jgi:hypothetical protein
VGANGTNGDPDNDGLDNSQEYSFNNPSSLDLSLGVYWRGTNPTSNDTDEDGIDDNDEDKNGDAILGHDETDPRDDDSDNDGLNDGEELAVGSDPLLEDSDNDGLLDGFESSIGTSPINHDTDGDDINDGDEWNPSREEWTMTQHDAAHTGYTKSPAPSDAPAISNPLWEKTLPSLIASPPLVADGFVFVASTSGLVLGLYGQRHSIRPIRRHDLCSQRSR